MANPNIHSGPLNLSNLGTFEDQYPWSLQYRRWQNARVLVNSAPTPALRIGLTDVVAGGVPKSLAHPYYRVMVASLGVDGVLGPETERWNYTRIGTEKNGTLVGSLGNEIDGPAKLQVVPCDAAHNPVTDGLESWPPFWVTIDRQGTARSHPYVVMQTGVYDWTHTGVEASRYVPPAWSWVVVPKTALVPRDLPLLPWYSATSVPPPATFDKRKLKRVCLIPPVDTDTMNTHRPAALPSGVVVTENLQDYFLEDMIATDSPPRQSYLDGKRGRCTAPFTLGGKHGRNGKTYGLYPHGLFVMDAEGTKRTLMGLRHKQARYSGDKTEPNCFNAPTWNDPNLETVGRYSSRIPASQRRLKEPWYFVWDPRSLALDSTRAPIGTNPPELPHVGPGPRAFVPSGFGSIYVLQFPDDVRPDLNTPPDDLSQCSVDIWISGLQGEWGLEWDDQRNTLLVGEREGHAIREWSADTPETKIRDIVVQPDGATRGMLDASSRTWVHLNRALWSSADAAAARAQCKVLAPEGMVLMGRRLHYASYALGESRSVDLDVPAPDQTIQSGCRPTIGFGSNSHYVFLAGSRGGILPADALCTTTFANQNSGRPEVFLAVAGTHADGTQLTHSKVLSWHDVAYDVTQGTGGATCAGGYAMGVIVSEDRITCGSSHSFDVWVQSNDAFPDRGALTRGAQYFRSKQYQLLHGVFGYGFTNYPLPWGENVDLDIALKQWGHDPNAVQPPVVVVPPPPVIDPIPPTGSTMQFKSVALRVTTTDGSDLASNVKPTDALSPLATLAQYIEMELHGSGGAGPGTLGPYYVNGDKWRAICDSLNQMTHLVGVDVPFLFCVMNSGGRPGVSAGAPILRLQPIDALPLQAPYTGRPAAWTSLETYHDGYADGTTPDFNSGGKSTGGTYESFTARKYDAMIEWCKVHYPQGAWNKKMITFGNSMGAWACFNYSLRRPQYVGAFFACNPRVRHQVVPDYNFGFGALNPNCVVAGTSRTYAQDRDHVAYVLDPANKTPFMCWTIAVNDGFSPFQDHIDMITACRQTGRAFAVIIHDGIHDSVSTSLMNARLRNTYTRDLFDGKGVPVLANSSRDGNVVTALNWTATTGRSLSINEGFKWTIVTETASLFVFDLENVLGADGQPTTVTVVRPQSDVFTATVAPQVVTIPAGAGQKVRVTFDSNVVVTPPPVIPPAKILSFTASKQSITQGETVTLSWDSQDTVFCLLSSLPNQQLPATGTMDVTPQIDTTYTLLADDRAANVSDSKQLTITVAAAPLVDPRVDALAAQVAALDARVAAAEPTVAKVDTFLKNEFTRY